MWAELIGALPKRGSPEKKVHIYDNTANPFDTLAARSIRYYHLGIGSKKVDT